MRHARVPEAVFNDTRLSTAEKLVVVVLNLYADGSGIGYPSLSTIAKNAGIDRRSAMRILKTLEEKNIIERIRRPRPGTKASLTTIYRLSEGYFFRAESENPVDREGMEDRARDALSKVDRAAGKDKKDRDRMSLSNSEIGTPCPYDRDRMSLGIGTQCPPNYPIELSKELEATPSQKKSQKPSAKEEDPFEKQLRESFEEITKRYPRVHKKHMKDAFAVFSSFFSREDPESNARRFQNLGAQVVLYAESKSDGKCIHNFDNWLKNIADPDMEPVVGTVTVWRRVEDE